MTFTEREERIIRDFLDRKISMREAIRQYPPDRLKAWAEPKPRH